ncbi:MAG: SGNH/GDSL hydrolase family protein [Acidobacteria bacterium]|nr:SGNH/GDSL hydrolase family protein [Acidobacteriota bacterium]
MNNPASSPDTESTSEGRAKPPLRVKLAVVAASVVFALLVFELFLRVVGYTYPVFYQPDEVRGYSLWPGAEGRYRREGAAFVRINSDGLRDREHAKEKPTNTLRIAVVGDSYAEAFQVEREQAFWSVLEAGLHACLALEGREVEVINFGVSGYGTAQELLTLREKVWGYSPDVVLLAVTTNNDVLDNSRALKLTDEIPYFRLDGDKLTLDDSFRRTSAFRLRDSALNRLGRWLREHLRFVQAIHEAQGAIKSRLDAWREQRRLAKEKNGAGAAQTKDAGQPNPAAPAGGAPADELGTANVIYREPPDDTWRDAWLVTERLLAEMNAEVKSHGARLYVVTLSNGIQVFPDPAAREAFAQRVGAADLFYAERRFQSVGEREGFPVYNLAPDLQAYADRTKVFLHGFGAQRGNGHWNEEGHRVAGELLTQRLCDWLARDSGGTQDKGNTEGGSPR